MRKFKNLKPGNKYYYFNNIKGEIDEVIFDKKDLKRLKDLIKENEGIINEYMVEISGVLFFSCYHKLEEYFENLDKQVKMLKPRDKKIKNILKDE
jgi:hypothetical protein